MRTSLTGLASISFVGGLVGTAFEYLVYLVLARSLGASAVGLFSVGFVVLSLATTVSKLGLDKAARKFVPIYAGDDRALTGVVLVCLGGSFLSGVAASVVLFFGLDLLVAVTGRSVGNTTALFLVAIPFMSVMTVGRAATTGFLRTRDAVLIKNVGQSGSALLFVLIAGYVVGTVESAVVGYAASLALGACLAVWFLYKQGGFSGWRRPALPARTILSYSLPLTVAGTAQYLISWTDVLMLGAFVSADSVGVYQVAYQTSMTLGFALTAVGTIFPSVASDLYSAGERDRLDHTFAALTKWVTYLAVFGYTFFAVYAETVLGLFGPEFASGRVPLLIVGLAITVATAAGPAGFLLMMTDYERVEMGNTLVASVLNVGLNYILIGAYGVFGAAVATGLSLVLLNALRVAESWLLLGVRPRVGRYWKGCLAIAAACGCMYLGTIPALGALPRLVVAGTTSFTVFVTVLSLCGFDAEDEFLLESVA